MIVRMWHGRVPTSKAQEYRAFLNARAIPDYQSVEGNISVHILERAEGEVTHFITMTFWESLDAIKAFAGEDIEAAKYYPEDKDFLLEFEPRVVHYEVVGRSKPDEAVKAICEADSSLMAAETARDLEAAMSHMAPDVILQPPNMPMVIGLDAVRAFYANWFALPYKSLHAHSQTVSVAASGDLAYLVGESSIVFERSGGERRAAGKYLGVWKKMDGGWKLAAICWNGDAPPD